MKFEHNQRLDTWATLEDLGPGDRITIDGKPATVFDLEEGSEPWIIYVLDGRKTKKQLSMYDALLPSETAEDEEDEWDDDYGEPDPNFVEKPEVEVRYIAPGKDLFDEPGIRKSPGRRNRPMTSHVPPVAEGKIMRITKRRLKRLIREAIGQKTVDLMDPDVNDQAIRDAWPQGVELDGVNIFNAVYENDSLMSQIYATLEADGYEDSNEVYLGYDFDSGDLVMGFDAFPSYHDEYGNRDMGGSEMEGVFVNIRTMGGIRAGRVVLSSPGGVYASGGVNMELEGEYPGILHIRLD